MEILFWCSILIIIYSYALFPIILFFVSALKQGFDDIQYMYSKSNRRHDFSLKNLKVDVVLSAYNEEQVIKQRIKNLLEQKPETKSFRIIVGSDGSSDNTIKELSVIDDDRLIIHDFKDNRGKVNVLNDLIAKSDADILIFTDANTEFLDDNINRLLVPFGDENVGAVCGELKLYDKQAGENKDGAYWSYERFIKFCESKLGGLLGANGANYAIRRELFKPFNPNVVIDDFENVMNIALQGKKVLYAQDAVAIEEIPSKKSEEYRRRVRIGNGNYLFLFSHLSLLNPKYGVLWWAYLSHKVFRWFTPHLMILSFFLNLLLLDSVIYLILFFIQLTVYLNSILSRFDSYRNRAPSISSIMDMFVYMNFALFIGFIKYVRGDTLSSWGRTER